MSGGFSVIFLSFLVLFLKVPQCVLAPSENEKLPVIAKLLHLADPRAQRAARLVLDPKGGNVVAHLSTMNFELLPPR